MIIYETAGVKALKDIKSIKDVGKAIGIEAIIGFIITAILIAGVIMGIFRMKNHTLWSDLVSESNSTYEYTSYNDSYIKELDDEVSDLYKNSRVLYGYSNIDHLSLENYSSQNIMLYGWDKSNSEKLSSSISNILEDVEVLKERTSFTSKEKKAIIESLECLRYFCDNQHVINKVRLEMKLTGELTQSNSNLNIEVIGDGGSEYLKDYESKMISLNKIFK